MRFVALRAKTGEAITDPLADALSEIGVGATGEAKTDVAAFLALSSVFPATLTGNPTFVGASRKPTRISVSA
jgi:fructuronate reductase